MVCREVREAPAQPPEPVEPPYMPAETETGLKDLSPEELKAVAEARGKLIEALG